MQDAWHRESLVLKGINTYYDRTQLSNFGGIKNIVVRNTKTEYEIIDVSEFIDNDESLEEVMGY